MLIEEIIISVLGLLLFFGLYNFQSLSKLLYKSSKSGRLQNISAHRDVFSDLEDFKPLPSEEDVSWIDPHHFFSIDTFFKNVEDLVVDEIDGKKVRYVELSLAEPRFDDNGSMYEHIHFSGAVLGIQNFLGKDASLLLGPRVEGKKLTWAGAIFFPIFNTIVASLLLYGTFSRTGHENWALYASPVIWLVMFSLYVQKIYGKSPDVKRQEHFFRRESPEIREFQRNFSIEKQSGLFIATEILKVIKTLHEKLSIDPKLFYVSIEKGNMVLYVGDSKNLFEPPQGAEESHETRQRMKSEVSEIREIFNLIFANVRH